MCAARTPPRRGRVSGRRSAALLRELVVLDGHVQGARHQRPPGVRSSPTSTRSDVVAPFVIFHSRFSTNTVAGVGARAAVPLPVPQRRDQHDPGQRAPDARARRCSAPRRSGSARRTCSARPRPGRLRLRQDRRGARAARARWARCPPRGVDARARGVGRRARPRPRRARLLPLPRVRSSSRGTARPGLIFTDGRRVGAALDRNGLRPMRWQRTRRRGRRVLLRGRCGAAHGPRARHAWSARSRGDAVRRPRRARRASGPGRTMRRSRRSLAAPRAVRRLGARRPAAVRAAATRSRCRRARRARRRAGRRSAATARRWPWCSSRWPPTPRSPPSRWATTHRSRPSPTRPRPVFNYLKQRFAQVSNPPIDHLRERLVMSLRTCLGPRRPLLTEDPAAARLLELATFFLYPDAVDALLDPDRSPFASRRIDATFAVADGPAGLATRVDRARRRRRDAVARGCVRSSCRQRRRASIPTVRRSRRCSRSVRCTTRSSRAARPPGRPRSSSTSATRATRTRSPACSATAPTRSAPASRSRTVAAMADDGQLGEVHSSEAQAKLQAAIEDGVLKIMSKMGISTVDGYRGAQIFEALGLGAEVVDTCLRGTPSTVGGIGFDGARRRPARPPRGGVRRDDAGARRAGVHPVPQARRRVPRQQPRDDRGAARVDRARRRRPRRRRRREPPCDDRPGRAAEAGKFAAVPVAPAEEQGRVIFFEGERAEPLPAG